MTKEEALQFKERWRLVNEFINEESRLTTLAGKLQQFLTLFDLARELGWETGLRADDDEVRARWRRLKEVYYVNI
jgi:hypothetical protein